jgi:hypothetical protein
MQHTKYHVKHIPAKDTTHKTANKGGGGKSNKQQEIKNNLLQVALQLFVSQAHHGH